MINNNLVLILFGLFNLILILNFSKINFFHLNIDKPDKIRKFHAKPTPLAGGQLIFLNILIYWIVLNLFEGLLKNEVFFSDLRSLNYFMIISTSIFMLGFIDDKINIKANLKFLILFITISFLLFLDNNLLISTIQFSFFEKNFNLNEFKIFFSIFCFLVFINAFNMFDGINLQASTYSLFVFFCILIFFSSSLFLKILIVSLISFSYLNFKNKAFLGDSGSLLVAFLMSYFFIKLYNLDYIKFADQIVLYMLIPGLDLIRLFIIRLLGKKNPLSSDRQHLHHLLMLRFSLNKTLVVILFLVSLPIILNNFNINNIYSIFISIVTYLSLIVYLNRRS